MVTTIIKYSSVALLGALLCVALMGTYFRVLTLNEALEVYLILDISIITLILVILKR